MNGTSKAIVVGVGPEAGLGGALSKRFAREGLQVFVAGRTLADAYWYLHNQRKFAWTHELDLRTFQEPF